MKRRRLLSFLPAMLLAIVPLPATQAEASGGPWIRYVPAPWRRGAPLRPPKGWGCQFCGSER